MSIRGKIFITGGTGFVGRHLQEELAARKIPFAVFSKKDFDLTNQEQAFAVFAKHQDAQAVIHLASYQAAADFPAKHTGDQFRINNLIHTNVLEAWRQFLPHAKLVAIGSSCAYPSRAEALTEDKFFDGEIHGSVYSYAFTKRLLCTGILAYNDQYKLNGSYLIPCTMFGEHDDFHVETAHVPGALMGKFVKAKKFGTPEVEIWGDGSQIRDMMYVKEFISCLLHLLPEMERDIVNVAPGKGISIRDLVEHIRVASGYAGKIVYNADRYVGVREKFMNARKLNEKYGWSLPNEMAHGVQRTVDWFRNNYDQVGEKRKFQN